MAFSVSPTPSYPGLEYSKGPRTAYYTNENYLKLFLNVAQTDDDDEWGRTEAIALRSVIDHVTDIWVNLYGTTPSSGGGIAGSNTEILKIVDTTNSRIVLPKGTGPASANTTSTTVLDQNGLTFDLGKTVGYFCGSLSLSNGNGYLELDSSNPVVKYLRAHSLNNFYVGLIRNGSTNSIRLAVPTGASDTDTRVFDFKEDTVSFPTDVSVSMGDTRVPSLRAGTGSFDSVNVDTDLDIFGGQISYCRSQSTSDPRNWMLTSYRLVIGPNKVTEQRLELNNSDGLAFYCGASGGLSGIVNANLLAQYSGGTQLATIESDGNGAHFKQHNGAEMNLTGDNGYFLASDSFRFSQGPFGPLAQNYLKVSTSTPALTFYDSGDETFYIASDFIRSKGWTVGDSSVNPYISFNSANKAITIMTDSLYMPNPEDGSFAYVSLTYPTDAVPSAGLTVFCGSASDPDAFGAYYYSNQMYFKEDGNQKLTITSSQINLDSGPRIGFSGTTSGIKNITMRTDRLRINDPDESANDYVDISLDDGFAIFCGAQKSVKLTTTNLTFYEDGFNTNLMSVGLLDGNHPSIWRDSNARLKFLGDGTGNSLSSAVGSVGPTTTYERVQVIPAAFASKLLAVIMTNIPAGDPGIAGAIYSDAGTLKISGV